MEGIFILLRSSMKSLNSEANPLAQSIFKITASAFEELIFDKESFKLSNAWDRLNTRNKLTVDTSGNFALNTETTDTTRTLVVKQSETSSHAYIQIAGPKTIEQGIQFKNETDKLIRGKLGSNNIITNFEKRTITISNI